MSRQTTLLRKLLHAAPIMIQGGLSETTRRCGNPSCACHRDPDRRHGPHLSITWTERGLSFAKILTGLNPFAISDIPKPGNQAAAWVG